MAKRQKGGRLRERDGRSLSSYARKGKTPFRYGEPEEVLEESPMLRDWRMPRNAKGHRTQPRGR